MQGAQLHRRPDGAQVSAAPLSKNARQLRMLQQALSDRQVACARSNRGGPCSP
jgi:hypothetical protein